jgi:hypothetical protein
VTELIDVGNAARTPIIADEFDLWTDLLKDLEMFEGDLDPASAVASPDS